MRTDLRLVVLLRNALTSCLLLTCFESALTLLVALLDSSRLADGLTGARVFQSCTADGVVDSSLGRRVRGIKRGFRPTAARNTINVRSQSHALPISAAGAVLGSIFSHRLFGVAGAVPISTATSQRVKSG